MKKNIFVFVALIAIFGLTTNSVQAESIEVLERVPFRDLSESQSENHFGTAMLCPLDPSGTSLEDYSNIVMDEPIGLTWVDLTADDATFFLSETQVDAKFRVAKYGVNVNLNWHSFSRDKYLGYQFIEKKQTDEVWDVHFSFRFHPNLFFGESQVIRMSACGQSDAVYLKQTAQGWKIGFFKN